MTSVAQVIMWYVVNYKAEHDFLAFSENTLFHVIEQLGLRDQSLFQ